MAAGTDGEESHGKASEFAVQAVYKGTGQRCMERRKGSPAGVYRSTSTAAQVEKERIVLERNSSPRPEGRK